MTNQLGSRSNFVTVVAWVFVVLSSLGSLVGVLQNVVVWTVFPMDQMEENSDAVARELGPVFAFVFSHFRLWFLLVLLVMLFAVASSLALLKRREWGRRAFIVLMFLGVLWNLAGLAMQLWLFTGNGPFAEVQTAPPQFRALLLAMLIVAGLIALTFCALFLWIARRLMSAEVRQEFVTLSA